MSNFVEETCPHCNLDPCDCDRRFDAWHDREYDDWGQAT